MFSVYDFYDNVKSFKNEKMSSSSEELSPIDNILLTILIIIGGIIILALYVWAFMILFKFSLPRPILYLSILFILSGNPIYAIIFGYLFNNKTRIF